MRFVRKIVSLAGIDVVHSALSRLMTDPTFKKKYDFLVSDTSNLLASRKLVVQDPSNVPYLIMMGIARDYIEKVFKSFSEKILIPGIKHWPLEGENKDLLVSEIEEKFLLAMLPAIALFMNLNYEAR